MPSRRIFTLGLDDEPIWVWLYLQPLGERWAAMLVADGVTYRDAVARLWQIEKNTLHVLVGARGT